MLFLQGPATCVHTTRWWIRNSIHKIYVYIQVKIYINIYIIHYVATPNFMHTSAPILNMYTNKFINHPNLSVQIFFKKTPPPAIHLPQTHVSSDFLREFNPSPSFASIMLKSLQMDAIGGRFFVLGSWKPQFFWENRMGRNSYQRKISQP